MPDAGRIQVEEFEELILGDGPGQVTPQQWSQVERIWRQSTDLRLSKCFEFGVRSIKPKNWVGTISSAEFVLEVLPRGAKSLGPQAQGQLSRNLDQMLRVGLTDRRIELSEAALASGASRFEPALEALADMTLLARRKKVLRAYRAVEGFSRIFRGRLSFPAQSLEQVRRPGTFAAARVELHEDTPENLFLKAAIVRLLPRVSGRVRRRLEEAHAQFDAVADVSEPWQEYVRIRRDRLQPEYAAAIDLAEGLLRGSVGGLLAGSARNRSEIVYTPELFERFVARTADDVAKGLGYQAQPKASGRYLGSWINGPRAGRGSFELIPDVEIRGKALASCLVIDAKWKWLDLSSPTLGVQPEDLHQAAVYGARLGCRRVALAYPWLGDQSPFLTDASRGLATAGKLAPLEVHILAVPLLWAEPKVAPPGFEAAISNLLH